MAHTRFKLRRGTAGEWAVTNPVLADGEPGIETDTGQVKFGNGADSWADRPYTTDYATSGAVSAVFVAGRWYSNRCMSPNGQTLALDALYVVPFWVPKAQSFDGIGVWVSTAAGTGGVVRIGVYPHNAATGWPNGAAPVVETAGLASTTTGAKTAAITWTAAAGLYWLAVKAETAACSIIGSTVTDYPEVGHASLVAGNVGSYVQGGTLAGSLPSPLNIATYNATTPRINLRAV